MKEPGDLANAAKLLSAFYSLLYFIIVGPIVYWLSADCTHIVLVTFGATEYPGNTSWYPERGDYIPYVWWFRWPIIRRNLLPDVSALTSGRELRKWKSPRSRRWQARPGHVNDSLSRIENRRHHKPICSWLLPERAVCQSRYAIERVIYHWRTGDNRQSDSVIRAMA